VARGTLEERRRIATDGRFGRESNDDESTQREHSDAERTSVHLFSPAARILMRISAFAEASA
jgi:hypothetical protein